jgi:ABC-type polysaccharide/polyol phosphate transport system ATPase subunit
MAQEPATDVAVSVQGVSKQFRIPSEQMHTIKERVLHPRRKQQHEVLPALNDVSLDIGAGEFFGIVGRNGSGKSTLMKCLAGIYRADGGDIWLRGRLAPFIELGVGFNPELTARDNVRINAIMLGLTPLEARNRFDEIIDFAELHDFVDLKLKNYSSGMQVRLGFAVMVHVNADILLIDEVLAVGDAAFQQKCHDVLADMRDAGRTILLVTHDMGAMQRFCHRAALMEHGKVLTVGTPRDVARAYEEVNFRDATQTFDPDKPGGGDGRARITDVWFEDKEGRPTANLPNGEPAACCIAFEAHTELRDPVFGFVIANASREVVFAATSAWRHGPTGTFLPGERAVVRMSFVNVLAQGRYALSPEIALDPSGHPMLDRRPEAGSFVVSGGREGAGLVDLPNMFAVERSPAGVAPEPHTA